MIYSLLVRRTSRLHEFKSGDFIKANNQELSVLLSVN